MQPSKPGRLRENIRDESRADCRAAEIVPRRRFLGGAGGLLTAVAAGALVPSAVRARSKSGSGAPMFAHVGCYTTEQRNGHGRGVDVYRMDPGSGDWTHIQLVEEIVNPSFLALDRSKRFLYAVHGDMTYATAFSIDATTDRLSVLNQQDTGGRNPVHLAVDPSNRFLVVSNYSSGSVAVLPINADGSLAPLSDLVELQGRPGPHPTEQKGPHPHHNPFDRRGRFFLVPDKGLDKVFVFRLDTVNGKLMEGDAGHVATRPGAGPRHVDFHPSLPCAYVINELDSTLAAYRYDSEHGELSPLQVLSTLPAGSSGSNTTSEIAVSPSGRFLYGSNRGHDSIAIFAIDQTSGRLTPVGWEPTQGGTPRYFGLDPSGTLLYACNQDSDTIVTFRVDAATGTLTPSGQVVKTGSPVTIVFR
jgi:6-phosphogluconolactonase (cycloisomerase 2 family)